METAILFSEKSPFFGIVSGFQKNQNPNGIPKSNMSVDVDKLTKNTNVIMKMSHNLLRNHTLGCEEEAGRLLEFQVKYFFATLH